MPAQWKVKSKRVFRSVWKHRLRWFLRIFWLSIFWIGIIVPLSMSNDETTAGTKLGELQVYSQNRERFSHWERSEVVKFSMDQVDSSINYLFIGSAAILGFVVKILIDPQLDPKAGRKPIPALTRMLLLYAAFWSLLSISCGFLGRLYFTMLADSQRFSIYDEVGFAVFGQLAAFLTAALLMVWAAFSMVKADEDPSHTKT